MNVGSAIACPTPGAIAPAAVAVIRAEAARAHPDEACGLLLARGGRIVEATVAPNVAADPRRRFEIDPAHLFAVHRGVRTAGLQIAGCWHSHPNGRAHPSERDHAGVGDESWLWLIAAAGIVAAFRPGPQGFEPVELEGLEP